jgi:ubiquitin carboxyl-terminal hydrolase 22/27/51
MNCVLQSILNNNCIQDHFFSGVQLHDHSKDKHVEDLPAICMTCELDALFMTVNEPEMTSVGVTATGTKKLGLHTKRSPFSPTQFLRKFWMASKDLAGYRQQDAHEFLIALLNLSHYNREYKTGVNTEISLFMDNALPTCGCWMHQLFQGVLQSSVTCTNCGFVSTAFDPFLDVSLDIGGQWTVEIRPALTDLNTRPILTLTDCLEHYTHREKLGCMQYQCKNCRTTSQVSEDVFKHYQ